MNFSDIVQGESGFLVELRCNNVFHEQLFEKIKNIYDKGIVFLREDGEEAETLVPANIIAILDSVSAKETDGMGEEPPVSEKRIPKAAAAERSEKEAGPWQTSTASIQCCS